MTPHQASKPRTLKQLKKARAIRRQPPGYYTQKRVQPQFYSMRRRDRAFSRIFFMMSEEEKLSLGF